MVPMTLLGEPTRLLTEIAAFLATYGWYISWLSLAMFVGSVVVIPLVLINLPTDYFLDTQKPYHDQKPASWWHLPLRLSKNLLGLLLLVLGFLMLFLPGQGLLTILIAGVLLDFPGKRALEGYLVANPNVWSAINWIRQRWQRPPMQHPEDPSNLT